MLVKLNTRVTFKNGQSEMKFLCKYPNETSLQGLLQLPKANRFEMHSESPMVIFISPPPLKTS